MKKILSILMAAVTAFTMSATVLAKGDDKSEENDSSSTAVTKATISFDSDKCEKYLHTFGNAKDTGFEYTISDTNAMSGRCLKISMDFSSRITNKYGGIYFDAEDFGLTTFSGYTMTVNFKPTTAAAKATKSFMLFSDGDQWISTNFATSDAGRWGSESISVPADKNNSKLGISFPITEPFSGDVTYIDEIIISDNYGKAIANIGDIDTSVTKAPNTFVTVITIILFILLIVVVVLSIVYIVYKLLWRFR